MEQLHKTHKITLYNDDDTSFEYVIACLIKFCDHSPTQAEQCAIIANNRGECDIVSGEFFEMYNIKNRLDELSLKTELTEYAGSLH
jgi:ATP-dependent Clp protease adaptor protein ClpS